MATTGWNGSAYTNGTPVSGDTLNLLTAPPPDTLEEVDLIHVSLEDDTTEVVRNLEDYITPAGIGGIALAAGSNLAVATDFLYASMETASGDELVIRGPCECAGYVVLGSGGTLTIEDGGDLSAAVTVPTAAELITVEDGGILRFLASSGMSGDTVALAVAATGVVVVSDTGDPGLKPSSETFAGTVVLESGVYIEDGPHAYGRMILAGDVSYGNITLAITSGMIEGAGTLTGSDAGLADLVCAEGVRDGGGNDDIFFQYGKSGTACTTGTAT